MALVIIKKIISGGQTGVDRAGLDAAMEAGISVGGYCPKGRLAEDGTIPDIYPLQELSTAQYRIRTEKNVMESDGTLILNKGSLSQGTKLTHQYASRYLRPCFVIQLDVDPRIAPLQVVRWIQEAKIKVLNVAGPRESKFTGGIYTEAKSYLDELFKLLKQTC